MGLSVSKAIINFNVQICSAKHMTRRKIGKTSLGLSCSLYQHHRILENRRPGALIFRDIFSLTYFGKYLKHKKFKIHLPPFGGRVMEMRERKGREKKEINCSIHIWTHRGSSLYLCIKPLQIQEKPRQCHASSSMCFYLFIYLFREHSMVEETVFK